MLTMILSFLGGVVGPLLPELLKLFRGAQDNKHELLMMEMRLKYAASEHMWRMEEVNAKADIEESKTLYQPQRSFGVQLLDAGEKWAETLWGKFLVTPAFYLFTILDFVNGMVRPGICGVAFGFYVTYKWAIYQLAIEEMDKLRAIQHVWTDNDWSVLLLVLGYFFGQRAMKAVFGGSTQTSKAGA